MSSRQMPERGMTLVEIMITLVISSIIAASTFMFFAGQQRIYEAQHPAEPVGRHGGRGPLLTRGGYRYVWMR